MLKPRFDRLSTIGFGLALLILAAIGWTTYRGLLRLIGASGQVAHSYQVIQDLGDLLLHVTDAESAARGFEMSGQDLNLEPFENAVSRAGAAMERLRTLSATDAQERDWWTRLEEPLRAKIAWHRHVIADRRRKGVQAAVEHFSSGEGQQLMATLRDEVAAIQAREERRLFEETTSAQNEADAYRRELLAGLLLSFGILGVVYYYRQREVERRRESEARLRDLNRFYAVINYVSQAIVRIRQKQELLDEICRIVVEYGIFRMAWVGMIEPKTRQVIPVAASGASAGYLDRIRIFADESPEGRGPTGSACREGTQFVCNEIRQNEQMRPWREAALGHGFESSASFPILIDGCTIGALTVYAGTPFFFDAQTVALLVNITSDLAFALKTIDDEARRSAAESALRESEERYRHLNEDLELRVTQRTGELEVLNRRLAERADEVERANRLKSQFLARMSHELRTPLNAIIGFSDLLLEESSGPLAPKQKRFVVHIQNGARHLLQVINDILDLSKIDAGRVELVTEHFAPDAALAEVLEVIRPLAESKQIRIRPGIPGDLVVAADRTRFKQILYNLLSNAVKFTGEGGEVAVDASTGDHRVCFRVSDSGIGIPAGQQAAIFDEFHQVPAPERSGREGTGLGLAITRRLVELHGGTIWVESRPGAGSRFFFTLPHAAGAESSLVEAARAAHSDRG